jgi:hypothetical protein
MPVRVWAEIQALPRTVGVRRSSRVGQSTGRASRRSLTIWIFAAVLVSTMSGWTANVPTVLVLPLEMVDTSGEPATGSKEHEDRLAASTRYLSLQLGSHGLYTIIDPTPIDAEIDKARAIQSLDNCNGCELDLARLVHAERVLIGEFHKVSTLIGSLHLTIVAVATGQSVFRRELGFRGDTDEAWRHAVRFFVRDLEETAAQQR